MVSRVQILHLLPNRHQIRGGLLPFVLHRQTQRRHPAQIRRLLPIRRRHGRRLNRFVLGPDNALDHRIGPYPVAIGVLLQGRQQLGVLRCRQPEDLSPVRSHLRRKVAIALFDHLNQLLPLCNNFGDLSPSDLQLRRCALQVA